MCTRLCAKQVETLSEQLQRAGRQLEAAQAEVHMCTHMHTALLCAMLVAMQCVLQSL
jgi:hypothetical protein